jgi:hypothetical protein
MEEAIDILNFYLWYLLSILIATYYEGWTVVIVLHNFGGASLLPNLRIALPHPRRDAIFI